MTAELFVDSMEHVGTVITAMAQFRTYAFPKIQCIQKTASRMFPADGHFAFQQSINGRAINGQNFP